VDDPKPTPIADAVLAVKTTAVQAADAHLDPGWRTSYKWHSLWAAAFWGSFGCILTILPVFVTYDNLLWFGPLMLLMSVTFAIARFTNQPGVA
jgi:hypothetical protein